MTKTAQLDREIAAALAGQIAAANTGSVYLRLERQGSLSVPRHRWIGRCKCGKTHKLEGHLMLGVQPPRSTDAPGAIGRRDLVVQTDSGTFTTAASGTDTSKVRLRCGDHHCKLARVHEGTKASKHTCGARCTNATGPNCDCRCKGANHGSNC